MTRIDTSPDYASYHRSLTEELYSIKDCIRNLVKHWATDGESKEVAVHSLLLRHPPESVIVGRGFIVAPQTSSTQIDVPVVDANKPTLFKNEDLLMVTPGSIFGAIEVKTQLRAEREFHDAISKLTNVEEMCRDITDKDSVWTGLFVFHGEPNQQETILRAVAVAFKDVKRVIN